VAKTTSVSQTTLAFLVESSLSNASSPKAEPLTKSEIFIKYSPLKYSKV